MPLYTYFTLSSMTFTPRSRIHVIARPLPEACVSFKFKLGEWLLLSFDWRAIWSAIQSQSIFVRLHKHYICRCISSYYIARDAYRICMFLPSMEHVGLWYQLLTMDFATLGGACTCWSTFCRSVLPPPEPYSFTIINKVREVKYYRCFEFTLSIAHCCNVWIYRTTPAQQFLQQFLFVVYH